MNISPEPNSRTAPDSQNAETEQQRAARLVHARDGIGGGHQMADIALWRSRHQRAESGIGCGRSIAAMASFFRLIRRGKGAASPLSGSIRTNSSPMKRQPLSPEHRRQRRFSRPRKPGHHQHLAVFFDCAGMQQQMPPPAERHLQVHPHFGGKQRLIERQRHGIGQHIIAIDRHLFRKKRRNTAGRLQPDAEIGDVGRRDSPV